ncbi:MAG: ABC transporter permease [Ornithinibacter sp.]
MNRTLLRLSTQALFGRRRGVVLLLIAGALLVLALLVRLLTDAQVGLEAVVGLGFTLALPLIALLAATAVLGPEIDDGSVVYLLAKPVNRHVIALSKLAAAWGATMLLGALPVALAALVLDGSDPGRAVALGLGAAASGTVYTALFLALAALTRHAVVVGLLFVLVWEGVLGSIFAGVRWLSVGAWGRAVADALSPPPELATNVSVGYALVATAGVVLAAVWFTGDRLRSFTLRGDE